MTVPNKVLLVDDEAEFVSTLSQRMETRGIPVDAAASGREALELAAKTNYDAVLLDLTMPEMDGLETLKRLLQLNPDLQVILLTGNATIQKGVEAIKLGAMDFLEKPARLEKILERIREAQTRRVLLVEKRNAERISNIITSKGW